MFTRILDLPKGRVLIKGNRSGALGAVFFPGRWDTDTLASFWLPDGPRFFEEGTQFVLTWESAYFQETGRTAELIIGGSIAEWIEPIATLDQVLSHLGELLQARAVAQAWNRHPNLGPPRYDMGSICKFWALIAKEMRAAEPAEEAEPLRYRSLLREAGIDLPPVPEEEEEAEEGGLYVARLAEPEPLPAGLIIVEKKME